MSESATQIELMQQRLETIAAREQALINALNDALMSADRKLLDEVRSVTAEHEARRTLILSELQTLADRIGAFPITAQPVDAIEHEVPSAEELPSVIRDFALQCLARPPIARSETTSDSNGTRFGSE